MSFEQGTATGYTDLLDKLDAFLRKGHTLTPVYTGTGTGTISLLMGTASSVQETITVTFTSSTAFNVVGSVTGAMGSGTVGSPFAHARCTFTVLAGGTAWAAADTISFVMTLPWTQMRGVAGSEYIWRAPGNAGTDQIFVGAKTFFNASADYYNWRLLGSTGYTSGNFFTNQPGSYTSSVLCLWNQAIPYWFVATGRRVIVVAKISTSYEMAHLGLLDTYASPGQYPYPLAIGGSMAWTTEPAADSVSWRWSSQDVEHSAFWKCKSPLTSHLKTSLALRYPDGQWKGFWYISGSSNHGRIWPWCADPSGASSAMSDLRPCLDGSYQLVPVVIQDAYGDATAVWGEFAGLMATTGYGNSAESTHPVGRSTWLVVQNSYRTTYTDYCAVRLD